MRKPSFFTLTLTLGFTCILTLAVCAGCGRSQVTAGPDAARTSASTHRVPAQTTTGTPSPTPTPPQVQTDRNPLTGLGAFNPSAVGRRPVTIMFSNIQAALPQLGIGDADLVYEMVIESGYTRLVAFYADVEALPEVCSIRSTRDSFVDIAMGHDAVLVHYGASVLCWDYMAKLGIQTLDLQFYAAGSWRDPQIAAERGAEHSVKTNAGLVQAAITGKGLRAELAEQAQPPFAFYHPDEWVPAGGADCRSLSLPFSTWSTSPVAGFTYDAAARAYIKSQYGGPQVDGSTGEPLRFTNVLLLFTTIYPQDKYGHVAARLEDGGRGYYLSGGKLEEIIWEKSDLYAPFTYTTAAGEPLRLNAGKSYVGVLSSEVRALAEFS